MRFVPSAYSDVAAVAPAAPATTAAGSTASGITEATQVLSQLVSSGVDVARAASDLKMAQWQQKAAKKPKKKQQRSQAMPASVALPASASAPAKLAAPPTDWAKWGLIGMGALVVAVLGYVVVTRARESDDGAAKKKNPKPVARAPFIRVPPRRRAPKVIDIEAEEIEADEPEPVEADEQDAYGDAGEEE
jgi:hypothetical protein